MSHSIRQGDALELLRQMGDGEADAVVTDPPYGLSFMGKAWDHDIPGEPYWSEALRVAKPGAHLLAFGGTRTYHRLACAIEDAGWEIRDSIASFGCLAWVYGSGFPKSLDVSKAIDKAAGAEREVIGRRTDRAATPTRDMRGGRLIGASENIDLSAITAPATDEARAWVGWGTALKPAWEPIILARKPLVGTVAANVLAHGTGALNVDGCKITVADDAYARNCSGDRGHAGTRGKDETRATSIRSGGGSAAAGRWPADVVLDEDAARMLDEQSGTLQSGFMAAGTQREGLRYRGGRGSRVRNDTYADSDGASRFFYTAKASSAERHAAGRNTHPTVKPVSLMRWLCRLVTPPGGLVLDPFCGSGSTGVAALAEGFRFIGFDNDPESVKTARRRIAGPLFALFAEGAGA